MATVTIGSTEYDVYQDVAAVDAYAASSVGDGATAWLALEAEAKPPYLVAMTRLLDRQAWDGAPTVDGQPHAWPRTGLSYADGTAVDPDTTPQQVLDAFAELCLQTAAGAAVQSQFEGVNTTKRLKAGSAEIEYFRGLPGDITRFPLTVMELIGLWLGGGPVAALSESTGTCEPPHFASQFEPARPI